MKRFWSFLASYKKILALALLLASINQIFSLLDPQIFRITVDRYIGRAGEYSTTGFLRGILLLLLASMGVALVSRIAKNFQDYYVNVIVQRLGTKLYSTSVQHAFSLPYSAFEDQRSGELLQKLQKARADVQELIKNSINTLFLSAVGMLFVLIYAFIVHWAVGLLYFLSVPAIGTITFLISKKIKEAQKRVVTETANLAGSTTETIRNVELVKSMGLAEQEISRLNSVNENILQLELEKIVIIRRLSFIQGTIINAIRSALLLLMFWLIYTQDITLGQMFSLFVYSFFIFTPLAEMGTVAATYQQAKASMEKLEDVLQQEPERQPANPEPIPGIASIEFEHVGFRHERAERAAIQDVSLTIRAGETAAFVGPSGSGKTTLMKLVVGLYQPRSGLIRFNATQTDRVDYDKLRTRIGLVAQETQLFAGTIRENLLFVSPRATDEECLAVLKAAAAQSILDRSIQGLGTRIGEGGLKLSGGEKQRLAIARALLRNPDLIVFDEATSSLDSITEKAITDTILRIADERPNLITLLVAHRLSTVARADRIYVLEKGRIIEHGNHPELLKRGGLYAALWREQSAGDKRSSSA
ncbi:MAG: ABC transporter ATP-binding protein [Candidatus Kerfeldbacteria bacterium]|nr:ABC transporter ATP-binding protein [Candidatus Kerfeldbacteria bacterium]